MRGAAEVRHMPVSRARTTAERVRKSRLIDAHGRVVSAAGLRVGYDDEQEPRALTPRSLAHLKEPLRAAGCALYPAVANVENPGGTAGRPARGRSPVGGPRGPGGDGGGGTGGHGQGHVDADTRLVEAAVDIGNAFEPITALLIATQGEQTVSDVMTGPLDEAGAEVLRALYQELVDTVKASRARIMPLIEDLTRDR